MMHTVRSHVKYFLRCIGRCFYCNHLKVDLIEVQMFHINYAIMRIPGSKRFLCSYQYPHPHTPEALQK